VHFAALLADSRATRLIAGPATFWVAAERVTLARAAHPDARFDPPLAAPEGAEVALDRDEAITAWCRDSWRSPVR